MIRIKQETEIHIDDDYGRNGGNDLDDGGHRSASTQSASSGDDDDECVSIIDCQMVNGAAGDPDSPHLRRIKTEQPEYYFDEESGQIIHFSADNGTTSTQPPQPHPAACTPNRSARSSTDNDSHHPDSAAETFTIRFIGNSNDTDPIDPATTLPPTNGDCPNGARSPHSSRPSSHDDAIRVKIYRCGRCPLHFERSYQLKRHSFVAHGGPSAGQKPNGTNGTSNGGDAPSVSGPKLLAVRAVPARTAVPRPASVCTAPRAEMVTITLRPPAPAQYRRSTATPPAAVAPVPARFGPTVTASAPIAPIPFRATSADIRRSVAPPRPRPPPPNPRSIRISAMTQYDAHHLRFDAATLRFQCKLCGQSAPKLADIDRHLQQHNGSQYAFRCELCDERIASLLLLKNHVHAHTCIGWPHRCRRCECRFERRTQIVGHQCAGRQLTNCVRCRLMFAAWPLKVAHERFVHGGRMEFGCEADGCGARFIHRAALGVHRQVECAGLSGGGGQGGGGGGAGRGEADRGGGGGGSGGV